MCDKPSADRAQDCDGERLSRGELLGVRWTPVGLSGLCPPLDHSGLLPAALGPKQNHQGLLGGGWCPRWETCSRVSRAQPCFAVWIEMLTVLACRDGPRGRDPAASLPPRQLCLDIQTSCALTTHRHCGMNLVIGLLSLQPK